MIVRIKNYEVSVERDFYFEAASVSRVPMPQRGLLEITLVGDYTDEDLALLRTNPVLELVPHDPNRKKVPPGDDERARRMQEEEDEAPHWSGCPDCGVLPCVCAVDMF